MGNFSSYAVIAGIEQILLLYTIAVAGLLGILSFQLYRILQAQDLHLSRGMSSNFPRQALIVVKGAIFWIFGYKGEDREKTSFNELNLEWVERNWPSIVVRLIPIYGLYILALVVWTRPVYLDDGSVHIFRYSTNLNQLFFLFVLYVSSNVVFDLLSLRFTLSCLLQALETKRYIALLLKNIFVAILLFFGAQTASCMLWIYKRQDPNFPKLEGNFLQQFAEITTWPYAFVTGPGSTEINSLLFPGQLLITGTVFIPTTLLILALIVFSSFLKATEFTKKFLLSRKWDSLCRILVRVRLVGLLEPPEKVRSFGYCNLAFVAFLDLLIVSIVSAVVSHMV
ncbi:hypothetical protein LPW26_21990 [Rhodopseudomonas sp. HC1]|uniref:hypothetical protein n=1 Tax=Rhodopseudomonas infernalis TaxID=2897386 RepID=UPI001EE84950|nr:hypothetical protein [Rhodopseudomonas infernalis]MCG6207326.1 hypothetical protein [Rhodopseudomonas infernalis]